MPTFQGTIDHVNQRVVNTRDGRSSTVYEIFTIENGQRYDTWNQQIANEANRLIGTYCDLICEVRQNGAYTNYKLNDLNPATASQQAQNNQPQPFSPAQQAQQAQPQPPQQVPLPIPQQPQQQPTLRRNGWEPDSKDFNIMRQTACKVSAQLTTGSSNPKDFWENLDALIAYMAYGQMPAEYQHTAQAPNGGSNQYVPESAVAEPWPGPTKPDLDNGDDIPFS